MMLMTMRYPVKYLKNRPGPTNIKCGTGLTNLEIFIKAKAPTTKKSRFVKHWRPQCRNRRLHSMPRWTLTYSKRFEILLRTSPPAFLSREPRFNDFWRNQHRTRTVHLSVNITRRWRRHFGSRYRNTRYRVRTTLMMRLPRPLL